MNESRNYCSLNTWAQGLISPGRLSLFPHSVCGAPAFAGSGGSFPRAPVLLRVHRGRNFSCCPTALCSCSMEACWGRSTVQPWSIWDTLPQLRCLMAELQALQASQWGGMPSSAASCRDPALFWGFSSWSTWRRNGMELHMI